MLGTIRLQLANRIYFFIIYGSSGWWYVLLSLLISHMWFLTTTKIRNHFLATIFIHSYLDLHSLSDTRKIGSKDEFCSRTKQELHTVMNTFIVIKKCLARKQILLQLIVLDVCFFFVLVSKNTKTCVYDVYLLHFYISFRLVTENTVSNCAIFLFHCT